MSGLLPALGGGAGNVIQLAAGGLSGVLAMSALIASGVVSVGPGPPPSEGGLDSLAILGCPGAGSVVAVAQPGDQMWVTGRSADGAYLRVYVPGPIGEDGWVPASTVNLLAEDPMPVVACADDPGSSASPSASTSPAPASLSPSAPAGATPSPTAPPITAPTPTPIATPAPTPTPSPTRSLATPTPTPRQPQGQPTYGPL